MGSLAIILLFIIRIIWWIVIAHVIMSWLIGFNVLNRNQPLVWQIWNGLERLLERAGDPAVREVILATNFTQEGEATAHYIGELLRARGIGVSRLARGVPVGSELEYVDPSTIAQALRDRRLVSD